MSPLHRLQVGEAQIPEDGSSRTRFPEEEEDIEIDHERLQQLTVSMDSNVFSTEVVDKKLRALDPDEKGPAKKDPHNWYVGCRNSALRADALVELLAGKESALSAWVLELQADAVDIAKALAEARAEQRTAQQATATEASQEAYEQGGPLDVSSLGAVVADLTDIHQKLHE